MAPASGNVAILLEDALFQNDPQIGAHLQLDLTQKADGTWALPVWGLAKHFGRWGRTFKSFNSEDHYGVVRSARIEGDRSILSIVLIVEPDQWISGGRAEYEITLTQQENRFEGQYTGTFRGEKRAGRAYGRRLDLVRILNPAPFKPGEHPRLVFRQQDLPELRRRATTTPEGQQMHRMLDVALAQRSRELSGAPGGRAAAYYAIGLATKYVLTGDVKYAEESRKVVESIMDYRLALTVEMRRGCLLTGVAIPYDLCYHVWPADFRDRVTRWMRTQAPHWSVHPQNNPTAHSNHHAGGAAGQAILAMAVLAEPGGRAAVMKTVAPSENLKVGKGVPVVRLENDMPILTWIAAGPFTPRAGADFLAGLGGRAKARPELGTEVRHGQLARAFAPVEKHRVPPQAKYTRGLPALNANGPAEATPFSTSYYYCVLDVPRAGYYQVRFIAEGTDVWFGPGNLDCVMYLNGEAFEAKDIARLAEGRYPIMLEVHLGPSQPNVFLIPRLIALDEETARAEIARSKRLAEIRNGAAPVDLDEYLACGWDEPEVRGLLHGWRGVQRWLMSGVGETGVCTEPSSYRQSTLRAVFPFLHSLEACLGRRYVQDFSTDWLLAGLVAQSHGPIVREAHGNDDVRSTVVERCGDWMVGWRTVPVAWQPAIRGYFDAIFGLAGDKTFNIYMQDNALYAVVNYPFHVPSATLEGNLPRFVADIRKGAFSFRNRYRDADDIITVLWLKSEPLDFAHQRGGGRPAARICAGNTDWRLPSLPTLEFPDNGRMGLETVLYRADEAAQTVVLTADGSRIYFAKPAAADGEHRDTAIRYLRSIAVDYSARSGAPALVAVADTVVGSKKSQWEWPLGGTIRIDGNRVQSMKGGLSLEGVVVAGEVSGTDTALRASATDGTFFCVFTVQQGTAPKFSVEGLGRTAKITVGQRKLRFDGKQIVLE
jgi:hypothetical protein